MNPDSTVRVQRTSGRIEDDWTFEGEIMWSKNKECYVARVFQNGGALEGQDPLPNGHVHKWIKLDDLLSLNPDWKERAAQVCQILARYERKEQSDFS